MSADWSRRFVVPTEVTVTRTSTTAQDYRDEIMDALPDAPATTSHPRLPYEAVSSYTLHLTKPSPCVRCGAESAPATSPEPLCSFHGEAWKVAQAKAFAAWKAG